MLGRSLRKSPELRNYGDMPQPAGARADWAPLGSADSPECDARRLNLRPLTRKTSAVKRDSQQFLPPLSAEDFWDWLGFALSGAAVLAGVGWILNQLLTG
jgi:hypothetical protein